MKITRRDFMKVAGVVVLLPLWQAAPAWLPALRPLLPRQLLLLLPQLRVLQLLPAAWSCLAPFS